LPPTSRDAPHCRQGSASDPRSANDSDAWLRHDQPARQKRVEEIFGWAKTVGGFRRTRFRGVRRTQLAAYIVGAAYNLTRMTRILAVST
jgi:hypothetical protein